MLVVGDEASQVKTNEDEIEGELMISFSDT
jgi:hypothetical protein